MQSFTLKSAQFRKEREESWNELDRILRQVQLSGFSSLAAKDLHELPRLYRSAVSSLSVARAISLDKNLLEYLEALVSRAYVLVYTEKRPPKDVATEFIVSRFPLAVFQYRWYFFVSITILALGCLCGFGVTLADPERFLSFVPSQLARDRSPESTTESLRQSLYSSQDGIDGLTLFASFLFTHNAKIGILCFCLGFVAGVPVVILLFYNGLSLGAMIALFHSRGLGVEFLAWVLQHGVTELGAVCLCGAAGLVLGRSLLFPGRWTRIGNLTFAGRSVAPIIVGSIVMFLIAGLLEGYVRQLVHAQVVRWMLALATLACWTWYFFWWGRKCHAERTV